MTSAPSKNCKLTSLSTASSCPPWTAEVWKDIPGFEDRYQASSKGRIRSLGSIQKTALNTTVHHKGKVLTQLPNKDGYLLVHVDKTTQAHRLICSAFHGPPPEDAECCHANDIRTDNRPENLSWGTRQSNAAEMGLRHRIKGKQHPLAVLTAFQAFMIQEMPRKKQGLNIRLAEALGVKIWVITQCRYRRHWGWLQSSCASTALARPKAVNP